MLGILHFFFIRKSHQHVGIKGLSFFVVAVVTAMYVYMKLRPTHWNHKSFVFRCGWSYSHVCYMKMKCPSSLSKAPPDG